MRSRCPPVGSLLELSAAIRQWCATRKVKCWTRVAGLWSQGVTHSLWNLREGPRLPAPPCPSCKRQAFAGRALRIGPAPRRSIFY